MNTANKQITLVIALSLLVIWNIATLSISPIAWFDEGLYASVAHSFWEHGTFEQPISPLFANFRPNLSYGPVYFMVSSVFFSVGGFGLFQFRLIGLLAGMGIALIGVSTLRKMSVSLPLCLLFALLYMTDTQFISNSHSGRVDNLANAFLIGGIFYYLVARQKQHILVGPLILVSLAIGLALLSTPRMVVFLLPMFVYPLIDLFQKRLRFKNVLALGGPAIILYVFWIVFGFLGWDNFLAYYVEHKVHGEETSFADVFMGPSLSKVPRTQYLLFATFVLSTVLLYGRFKVSGLSRSVLTVCVINVAAYFFFLGSGPILTNFVLPYLYLAIVMFIWEVRTSAPSLSRGVVWLLLLFNIALFSVKTVVLLDTAHERNMRYSTEAIQQTIPPGAKVVGSPEYHYSSLFNKNDFQLNIVGGSPQERVSYHLSIFDTDYLIFTRREVEEKSELLELYLKAGSFEKIHDIRAIEKDKVGILKMIPWNKLGWTPSSSSYEGSIFKRIR